MTMTGARVLDRDLTWQQFLDLPVDDRYRHAELINGEVVLNTPTPLHQLIVGNLWSSIKLWTRNGGCRGEVTLEPAVRISERTGYLPDIAWYRQDKCAPLGQPPAFANPPDLVVEVLSPSTRSFDAIRKCRDYAAIGVAELWLIDPDAPEATVLRAPDADARAYVDARADVGPDGHLSSLHLPGFTVGLRALTER